MPAIAPLPPGPRDPAMVQLVRWLLAPTPFLDDAARRYGDCFTLRLPNNPPLVVLADPAAIRDVFTGDPDELPAGEANVLLRSVLGENSLLLLDGARHRRERKLLMPPFHGERMRAYGLTMRAVTDRVIDGWPRGRSFPIHAEMQRITLEVILRTVFGLEAGAKLERMRALLTRWTNLGATNLGMLLLMFLPGDRAKSMTARGIDPIRVGPLTLDLSRFLPWAELAKSTREVDDLLHEEFTSRRRAGDAASRDDVLSMLLQARDEHGEGMSDEELRDELVTLLVAGHETSATTLAWTFHRVLSDPRVLSTLQAELATVTDAAGHVDPDAVTRLDFLDAVVKESMRLTPILTNVARKLTKPTTLGGRALPAGCRVLPCMWLVHRNPTLWPAPLRFDPWRFAGKKVDPYTFFPFGGGARRCIGMAFAIYEMKIVLAEVMSRATLRSAGGNVKEARRGITLAPSDGVRVLWGRS